MLESALARKMKLKPGQRAALVNAPDGYLKALSPLPAGVEVAEKLVNLISVDETWSAFALRPYKPGEKRQSFR